MNHQGISMNIQTDISDELIDRIADKVFEKLKPLLSAPKYEKDTIFDVKGLAAYLNVNEEWVRDKARNGQFPCFKTGNYYKFRERDIDKNIQKTGYIATN